MRNNVYIGQLDARVSIIERTRTTSTTGEKTVVETLFNTVWARIDDVSGQEEEDGKVIALNVRKYILRYDPDLEMKNITDLYIQDMNDLYNIHSVSYIGRKEFIQLKCSKRE